MFRKRSLFACTALISAIAAPAYANDTAFEASFNSAFGTELREPISFEAIYESKFEEQIAELANGSKGRIGVYAVDLASGEEVAVLGDMRFPMASTSKVAVAATFLDGVDKGRYSLTSEYPLMIPIRSKKFSSERAPVKEGNFVAGYELISLIAS